MYYSTGTIRDYLNSEGEFYVASLSNNERVLVADGKPTTNTLKSAELKYNSINSICFMVSQMSGWTTRQHAIVSPTVLSVYTISTVKLFETKLIVVVLQCIEWKWIVENSIHWQN